MVPELDVSDFSESLRFYTEILGFQVLYARHNPKFVYLEQEDLQFMLIQEKDKNWIGSTLEKPYGRGINLQMELEDIRPVYERLINHNMRYTAILKTNGGKRETCLQGNESFGYRTQMAIYYAFASF